MPYGTLSEDKPFRGYIHQWERIPCGRNKYYIRGIPQGHPNPKFKEFIRTSTVIKKQGNRIETENSIYELVGKSNPPFTIPLHYPRKY